MHRKNTTTLANQNWVALQHYNETKNKLLKTSSIRLFEWLCSVRRHWNQPFYVGMYSDSYNTRTLTAHTRTTESIKCWQKNCMYGRGLKTKRIVFPSEHFQFYYVNFILCAEFNFMCSRRWMRWCRLLLLSNRRLLCGDTKNNNILFVQMKEKIIK